MWRMIVDHARAAGLDSIRLTYIASGKNGLVADLLPKLGFNHSANAAEGEHEAPALVPEDLPEDHMKVD